MATATTSEILRRLDRIEERLVFLERALAEMVYAEEEIGEELAKELDARIDELKSGKAELVTLDEVFGD